ncbi:hypothetical protein [Crocosphaera sp.]|uniref:hypothetical protein n=1 Tax=Crocosphaera sp. TaxID=2729996 RepID=UPI003F2260E6|nr:hypothetical protein [Crocosphaera sp.]
MNENLGKHLGELEIADLIEESVANAAQRRQQFAENSLVDITEGEAKNIEGGQKVYPLIPCPPQALPYNPNCPFIIGIILVEPITL